MDPGVGMTTGGGGGGAVPKLGGIRIRSPSRQKGGRVGQLLPRRVNQLRKVSIQLSDVVRYGSDGCSAELSAAS